MKNHYITCALLVCPVHMQSDLGAQHHRFKGKHYGFAVHAMLCCT